MPDRAIELIRLDALDETDAATLLDHLAPELPAGPLRSRILAAAEGNPLFVEQFVAYVADETSAGECSLDERTDARLSIPPTIGALLAARLDRLPDAERRILERAAVIGRTFWARRPGRAATRRRTGRAPSATGTPGPPRADPARTFGLRRRGGVPLPPSPHPRRRVCQPAQA